MLKYKCIKKDILIKQMMGSLGSLSISTTEINHYSNASGCNQFSLVLVDMDA